MTSGADHMWYLYHVNDMMQYLEAVFGEPDKSAKSTSPADFKGMKGIIVIKGCGWGDAAGHVTLWNGTACSATCHLLHDPENVPFVP